MSDFETLMKDITTLRADVALVVKERDKFKGICKRVLESMQAMIDCPEQHDIELKQILRGYASWIQNGTVVHEKFNSSEADSGDTK